MTHGTVYAYRTGCRCADCTTANYRAQKRWRTSAAGKPVPDGVHGTINGYKVYGCRCEACKKAQADGIARTRARQARMRALVAAGLPADWEGDIPGQAC